MLIIVTTEGLKKYYGNSDSKVDISNLNQGNIDLMNSFLMKIKVQLNVEIITPTEWNFNEKSRKTDFRKLLITNKTTINDLYFILNRDAYVVISFSQI
jgi:hypothetical protein